MTLKQTHGKHNNRNIDADDDDVVEDKKTNRLGFVVFFLVLMGSIVLETK